MVEALNSSSGEAFEVLEWANSVVGEDFGEFLGGWRGLGTRMGE